MNKILEDLDDVSYSADLPEVKLKYTQSTPNQSLPVITSPQDAYKYLLQIWNVDLINFREEFVVLLLNNAKKCTGWAKISIGGTSGTVVEPVVILQIALLTHSSSIVLAHNHPSGTLRPSRADTNLTKRIHSAGKTLGIRVEDHLILTDSTYYSFRDEGLL